jgi:hypothetical protein
MQLRNNGKVLVGVLVIISLLVLANIVVIQAQGVSGRRVAREVPPGELGPYTRISGPVEQGDTGFWHAPYVPVGKTGISGPVEQGDMAAVRSAHVSTGQTGVSGPVEQGDAGFVRSLHVPTGATGISGPVEQGDTGF